jgi:hypothetical protein
MTTPTARERAEKIAEDHWYWRSDRPSPLANAIESALIEHARAAVAAERERCAREVERPPAAQRIGAGTGFAIATLVQRTTAEIAAAIRKEPQDG